MSRSFVSPLLCLALLSSVASAADPFLVTTPGKPGGAGLVPVLSGSGSGFPGTVNALKLAQAANSSSATLVVGLSELAAPFKGGVLGPSVDMLVPGLPTDGQGKLALPFVLPAGAPSGVTLWTQCWVIDPAASGGLSASNSLAFTVQAVPAPLYNPAAALVVGTQTAGPTGVVVGDFDEDGVPDLAVHVTIPDLVLLL
jgi:hypothetical protein